VARRSSGPSTMSSTTSAEAGGHSGPAAALPLSGPAAALRVSGPGAALRVSGPGAALRAELSGPAAALRVELSGRCRWPAGTGVALAVSGGPDSLALLILAVTAGLDVVAIHVDHGLRAGSADEAGVVADVAARWGAGFESRCAPVEPGPNLEARARAARYAALPPGVLTGHTADDRAETVLLNLLRGAGLDGLAAPGNTARVGRPLLTLRRHETNALCAATGVSPVRDPSNDDLAFRRNAVRHRLLPLLAEIGARDPVVVLNRQSDLLAEDAAYLDALAADIDPTDVRAVRDAPAPLARRALRRWLRAGSDAEHHPPSAADLARVLRVARGEVVACQIAGGRRVARRAGRLRIETPAADRASGPYDTPAADRTPPGPAPGRTGSGAPVGSGR
jgi:tRNA(Ile)-lysidine synthase